MTVPRTSAPGPFPWHRYLAPRHWPTWLGLGLLRAWGVLPYPLLLGVGRALGTLGWWLVPSRRRVARTNLRLVFPELPEREVRRLARRAFINAAIALGESALAWWGREARLARLDHFEGAEHLERALAQGRGALLLGGHYTTLEISGRLLARHCERVFPTYKPAHSPLFEAVMARARRRIHAGLIPSRDMRALLRRLRENQVVWYAPDQDFGLAQSVMAPFMGVPAATLTLTARLAARSGAPVLPLYSERLPGTRGYLVRIGPPLENFPSGDEAADAAAVNRAIEAQVRRTPDQYLWGHRRFKTRPRGEAEFYPPRRDSRLRRYSLALAAAALPLAALTAWQALRARSPGYLPARLGLARPPAPPCEVWIHAASVGEVNAVQPLVEELRRRHPGLHMVLTTATPTGRERARAVLPEAVRTAWLPLDYNPAVRRFVDTLRPRCLLVVETEIWPNLFLHCRWRGVPVVMVNGRLSPRSLEAPRFVRLLLARALEAVYAVLARSEADRAGFSELSFPAEHIQVLGNLKLSRRPRPAVPFAAPRPYVLAASTRPGEERLVAEQWMARDTGGRLLVIAPRHPRRRGEILRDLAPWRDVLAVRSRGEEAGPGTRIYLADTLGELESFIAGAEFVIMGGGFGPFGGHNVLEPAQAGKAVIFGPHMDNFAEEAALLLEAGAALQADAAGLGGALDRLLADPGLAALMGGRGQRATAELGGVAARYVDALETLLPRVFQPPAP